MGDVRLKRDDPKLLMPGGCPACACGIDLIKVFHVEAWKVSVYLDNGRETKTYFAEEGLARLAVEWAYQVRLEEVRRRREAVDIEEYPLGSGSTDRRARKLTWWKSVPGGVVAMKDYFDAHPEVLERRIVGT